MKYVFFMILLVFVVPSGAHAELFECNGVWQNFPCDGPAGKSLTEIPHQEPSAELQQKQLSLETSATKRREFMKLRDQVRDTERDLPGFSFSLDAVEQYCDDESVSVPDCLAKVEATQVRLEERIDAAKARAVEEEENAIAREKNEQPTVVVVEPRRGWRHRHRDETCYSQGSTVICDRSTPSYRRHKKSGSAGVAVELDGTNATVGGGVRGGVVSKKHTTTQSIR